VLLGGGTQAAVAARVKTMTEYQWNNRTNWKLMLNFLRGRASDRKLRLLSVACYDRLLVRTGDERQRVAVRTGERYADGLAFEEERQQALRPLRQLQLAKDEAVAAMDFELAAQHLQFESPVASEMVRSPLMRAPGLCRLRGARGLVRDLFGPPLFRPVPIDAAWLIWNGGTVRRLAEGIYPRRAFEDLGVLADALEEAGCHDAEILAHCRGPGPHVRGCWPLDALLGRE
jgi:hypothetical protein